MLGPHHAAAKARLEAHTLLTGAVDDVARLTIGDEAVRENYVVLTVTIPEYEDNNPRSQGGRLTAEQSPAGDADLMIRVRVVAVDLDGVYLLMDAVSEQFLGPRLQVEGRSVTALTRELDDPVFDRVARLVYMDGYFEATTSRA